MVATENTRKRPSESPTDSGRSKKLRIDASPSPSTIKGDAPLEGSQPIQVIPTHDELFRSGLQRSIALALQHVGFDGASKEALESFTQLAETYFSSLAEDVMRLSNACRRSNPNPMDFELSLKRFNLPTSLLKPHLKNPVPRSKLVPQLYDPLAALVDDEADFMRVDDFDFLGEELSGKSEKESKEWIPSSFPAFPSVHSYKYTPMDANEKAEASYTRSDPDKMRKAISKESQQAEDALRKLMRSKRVSEYKELQSKKEQNPAAKERIDLWENMMKGLMGQMEGDGKGKGAKVEIADHSMSVNSEKRYRRMPVQRSGNRNSRDVVSGRV